ncbi:MAG TPA: energy transducer TonB [Opitutales bacterium]|nr:energy transducer TonB [Opitutales bacterium]
MALAALTLVAGCSKKTDTVNEPQPQPVQTTAALPTPPASTQPVPGPAPAAQKPAKSTFTRPKLIYFPKPAYPNDMYLICKEGEVCASMLVSAEGTPSDIKVTASNDPSFSNALLSVIPLWRFEPATRDGLPVAHLFKVAIPFFISNRPVDLPESTTHGQAELFSVKRPPHSGHGAASAVAEFTLASDTIVSDVKIVESTGVVDQSKIVEALSQWVFIPSRTDITPPASSSVRAGLTFTEAGNVLIQYPYPAPTPSPVAEPAASTEPVKP